MKEIEFGNGGEAFVLALGYFDCVHQGHRLLIGKTKDMAMQKGSACAVMTFENEPFPVLGRKDKSIYGYHERLDELEELGVDVILKIHFDKTFMALSANDFLQKLSLFKLDGLTCGYDFTFGKNKTGDAATLDDYCRKHNIDFYSMEKYETDGMRVSSSEIRRLLFEGRIEDVNSLLGKPYKITGKVVSGDGRGKFLGYPTANLLVYEDKLLPREGVYGAICELDGNSYRAMLHIGARPTYGGGENRVEAHLLDFNGDLYGRALTLRVLKRIRGIKEFGSSEQLRLQLAKDKKEVMDD